MYGDGSQRGHSTGIQLGNKESAMAANTFYSGANSNKPNKFLGMDQKDHKEAVNGLYNKRNTHYNQLYNSSEQQYRQRAEVDNHLSQF